MIQNILQFTNSANAQGKAWNTISSRCVVYTDVPTIQGLECLFANVLSIITAAAGLVFFGMFIVGGFQYLSSHGDQKGIAAANNTLTNSVIGLVGSIASVLILRLIADFTGVQEILKFRIGL